MTKAVSFNTVLNDIELIQNEMDEFIKEVQSTKEGKLMSYEYLKNIFFFWKVKQLFEELKSISNSIEK